MVETRKLEAIMEVLRNPQEPFVYRTLAHKLHLCIYILYQIYDWMLIHQHELVMDILMPFHCPRCAYRIHPPEMLGTPAERTPPWRGLSRLMRRSSSETRKSLLPEALLRWTTRPDLWPGFRRFR
ncbi:hypothetical protein ACFQX6_18475 [Streptosporangium lutulentum]